MKISVYLTYVTGPKMGVDWIYGYDGSEVRAALGTIGRPRVGDEKRELVFNEKNFVLDQKRGFSKALLG